MKKVLIFIETSWAFGNIFNALSKILYKHNIILETLSWDDTTISNEELNLIFSHYDLILTLPIKVPVLLRFGVPIEKIIISIHAEIDLYYAVNNNLVQYLEQSYNFAVIGEHLQKLTKSLGIERSPIVTELGIIFDQYYAPPPKFLSSIGYATIEKSLNFFEKDIKRGYLVRDVVSSLPNLNLVMHKYYYYLCMPQFYRKFDTLVMSSTEEGGGLPAMEAAAAGRLVIGTPVGYFKENAKMGGGVLVPVEESEFVRETVKTLQYFSENPTDFQNKCYEIQQFAREHYDWSYKVDKWIELFE